MFKLILSIISLISTIESSFVHIPIVKKRFNSKEFNHKDYELINEPHFFLHNTNKLVKREDTDASFEMEIKFDQIFYEATFNVGSNKDQITVLVDTASSDLIINSYDNIQCQADADSNADNDDNELFKRDNDNEENNYEAINYCIHPYPTLKKREISYSPTNEVYIEKLESQIDSVFNCTKYGVFNENNSSSFQNLSIPLNIEYGDGTMATGYYGIDNIYFNNIKISNITIGLNINSYREMGILGIGFKSNENSFQNGYNEYDNFPIQLKNQDLINKIVYSFYAPYSSKNLNTNSILFGAYDSTGFIKSKGLTLLPLINYNINPKNGDGPYYISITLNSISINNQNLNLNNKLIAIGNAPVILDCGSTASVLPYYIFNEILINFDFKWSNQLNSYIINENEIINKDESYLNFNFQNAIIKIPIIDFTLPVIDGDTLSVTGLRSISINYSNNDYFLLGDDFLSSVYFVVDIEDKNIAIGQVNSNKSSDSIVIVNDEIEDAVKSSIWDQIYGYKGSTSLKLINVDNPNNITTMDDSDEDLELYIQGLGIDLKW